MKYDKKLHILFFELGELEYLYKKNDLKKILSYKNSEGKGCLDFSSEFFDKGLPMEDLRKDKRSIKAIDELLSKKHSEKEEIEIFFAIDLSKEFYGNGDIGFELKDNVIMPGIEINTLDDLKKIAKEETLTDFIIGKNREYRRFQLKQYKGLCDNDNLFDFIKKKLIHYGNDIGDVNLLIQLQCSDHRSRNYGNVKKIDIDFDLLHNKIKDLKLKQFTGQVLLKYNNQNISSVINQVYPKLTTSSRSRSSEN